MANLIRGYDALDREELDTDVLGMESLTIDEEYRGHKFGYVFMARILSVFTWTVHLLHPSPLIKPGTDVPPSQRESERMGLISYWKRFGFREIGDTEIFHHQSSVCWPDDSYMAEFSEQR
jgi:hypothetical protein